MTTPRTANGTSPPPAPTDVAKVAAFLQRLVDRGGFFGSVTLTIQNGKVHAIRVEQVMKVDELG